MPAVLCARPARQDGQLLRSDQFVTGGVIGGGAGRGPAPGPGTRSTGSTGFGCAWRRSAASGLTTMRLSTLFTPFALLAIDSALERSAVVSAVPDRVTTPFLASTFTSR